MFQIRYFSTSWERTKLWFSYLILFKRATLPTQHYSVPALGKFLWILNGYWRNILSGSAYLLSVFYFFKSLLLLFFFLFLLSSIRIEIFSFFVIFWGILLVDELFCIAHMCVPFHFQWRKLEKMNESTTKRKTDKWTSVCCTGYVCVCVCW